MRIERRSIFLGLFLSIITCGIYQLYWIYKITDEMYMMLNEPRTAGIDILLSILTCGIYYIYLNYKWGSKINKIRINNGLYPKDDSIIFLILSIFGLSLVNICIIQSSYNDEIIKFYENNNEIRQQ